MPNRRTLLMGLMTFFLSQAKRIPRRFSPYETWDSPREAGSGRHASEFGRPAPTTKAYDWLLSTDSKEDPSMVIRLQYSRWVTPSCVYNQPGQYTLSIGRPNDANIVMAEMRQMVVVWKIVE